MSAGEAVTWVLSSSSDRRDLDDVDDILNAARGLINAIDDMHARGETFTPRVSLATAELRRLLAPTWPKAARHVDNQQLTGKD
jgi:hypothetical protein